MEQDYQKQILDLQDQLKAKDSIISDQNELLEGFKTKEADYQSKISGYQEQVLKLRDMNTDLFLRVNQPIAANEIVEEVKEPTITLGDITSQW